MSLVAPDSSPSNSHYESDDQQQYDEDFDNQDDAAK